MALRAKSTSQSLVTISIALEKESGCNLRPEHIDPHLHLRTPMEQLMSKPSKRYPTSSRNLLLSPLLRRSVMLFRSLIIPLNNLTGCSAGTCFAAGLPFPLRFGPLNQLVRAQSRVPGVRRHDREQHAGGRRGSLYPVAGLQAVPYANPPS